jgi:hypothetical protein
VAQQQKRPQLQRQQEIEKAEQSEKAALLFEVVEEQNCLFRRFRLFDFLLSLML